MTATTKLPIPLDATKRALVWQIEHGVWDIPEDMHADAVRQVRAVKTAEDLESVRSWLRAWSAR